MKNKGDGRIERSEKEKSEKEKNEKVNFGIEEGIIE